MMLLPPMLIAPCLFAATPLRYAAGVCQRAVIYGLARCIRRMLSADVAIAFHAYAAIVTSPLMPPFDATLFYLRVATDAARC